MSGLKMMKSSRRRSSGMDDDGGTASIAAILQSVGNDIYEASSRQKFYDKSLRQIQQSKKTIRGLELSNHIRRKRGSRTGWKGSDKVKFLCLGVHQVKF